MSIGQSGNASERASTSQGVAMPPILDIDPYADETLLDPYPFFERLRETAPVVRMAHYDAYAIGRHADVSEVLRDVRRFSTGAGIGLADITVPGSWGRKPSVFTETEGEDHARNRAVLTRIISPIVIRKWKEDFQRQADAIVERVLDLKEVDGVGDLAEAYILKVLPGAVGFTVTRDQAIITGDLNFNQLGPNNALLQESLKKAAPHMEWYNRQMTREALMPGSVGDQIYDAADKGLIPIEVAPEMIRAFLRAGMDSTIAGVGSTIHYLAKLADQWQLVRADPAKARQAFEEAIRLETPSQYSYRKTTCDVELSGHLIPANSKVAVYFASANRDPRKWSNPACFDLGRNLREHMAFGDGPHVCLGQNIARLEADCIVSALARRVKSIELTGEPVYRLSNALRTLDRLPIRVEAV